MTLSLTTDCTGVNWQAVADTLRSVGMASRYPEKHRRAFEASYATIFIYSSDTLVGFGRAISDGVYQAAIYDCAVAVDFQGQGIGRMILDNLLSRLQGCNVILYASPGKEGFYEKHGFRRMKTGMARFVNGEFMQHQGFTE
ncbi:MAG: GNAT family N-acetyltransferase [Desulforhopalus sp.]|nr:GNAT family N-acetyltransferase [Desulforhopalus sp.]